MGSLNRCIFLILCLLNLPWIKETLCAQESMVIYDDARRNGWQDYGWATINYSATGTVHSGSTSISVSDPTTSYQAIFLHHDAFDTSPYQSLQFWINGGTSGGQKLQVVATRTGTSQKGDSLPILVSGSWQQYTIPLSSLGVASVPDLDGIMVQNISGAAAPTFYLDDISLIGAAVPNSVHLYVDAQNVVRVMDSRIYGINLVMWDPQLSGTASSGALNTIDSKILRFPGGSRSDDYNWSTNRSISDNVYWANTSATYGSLAENRGAQAMVTVNYGDGTPEEAAAWVAWANASPSSNTQIGVDSRGTDWKTAGYWAGLRSASPLATDDGYNFLRISHSAPLGWKYWEVGNECYGSWERDQHGVSGSGLSGVAHDPYTYAQSFANFYAKMFAVDSSIKIGAVAVANEDGYGVGTHPATNPNENNTTHTGWSPVMLATLKSLGVTPHFLIHHFYPQNGGTESDQLLLQTGSLLSSDAVTLRKLLTDYIGGTAASGVELNITELNSVSSSIGKQTISLINGLFMAEILGRMSRTEFNTCTGWDLHNGTDSGNNNGSYLYGWRVFADYGILASSGAPSTTVNTPYPPYYAAKLLTHWGRGGDLALTGSTDYPWISVHAARRSNGNLALLVVNKGSATDISAQINLSGFVPSSGTASVWSYGKTNDLANGDLTSGTTTGVSSSFAYSFPAYSMTVIDLAKPAPASLTWVGGSTSAGTNVWNAIGNLVWSNGQPFAFSQADNVSFTDSGSNSTAIVLTGTLQPGNITVNANKDYIFGGSGILTGTMGLIKSGTGTLMITGSHSFSGSIAVQAGTLRISGTIANSGGITVSAGATLSMTGGSLTSGTVSLVAGAMLNGTGRLGTLMNNGTAEINGGGLLIPGSILNTGTMRILGGGTISSSGTFTNNGVLDVITAGSLPPNLVNNGLVIDSSSVRIQQIAASGSDVHLTIQSLTGHNYQLQHRATLTSGTWTNLGSAQAGNGAVLNFLDPGALSAPQGFYRIQLQP